MIWLTWRQFRVSATVALGALIGLAILIGVTGADLRDLYDTSGIATCASHGDCGTLGSMIVSHDHILRVLLGSTLLAAPALTGMFWGAPLLAREFETGTYRLAWTQSISRTRWLAVKVAIVGLASIAACEIFSLMLTWWSAPIDHVNLNRLTPSVFDERGIVAIGYAAFAFAAGVTAGALLRRTLPAMITTLVTFVAVRFVIREWLRPHLEAPLTLTRQVTRLAGHTGQAAGVVALANKHASGLGFVISGAGVQPPHAGDWVLASKTVTTAGQVITAQHPGCTVSPNPTNACIDSLHSLVTYQPATRYWPFQTYEMAIFLILALLLVGVCFWSLWRSSPQRSRVEAPARAAPMPAPRSPVARSS